MLKSAIPLESVVLGTLTAFLLVLFTTPVLIKVARLKHLVDEPGEDRKLHRRSIPTIGGSIIFATVLFTYALWFPFDCEILTGKGPGLLSQNLLAKALSEFKFLVASVLLLFFIGIKDDIIGTAPSKKMLAQILVGFILVVVADVRIHSMHGLFGVNDIPEWASILLSVFTYLVITNAFNLIDGVDGLATGVGAIASIFFGLWFYYAGDSALTLLAFTLAGTLLGFLIYNFSPAKVFMGDSGSLTTGMLLSYLAIRLIGHPGEGSNWFTEVSTPLFAMGVLAYPLIDTLRVFTIRTLRGRSPFEADKNHVHHRLLRINGKHHWTVLLIYAYSLLVIASCTLIRPGSVTLGFGLNLAIAVFLIVSPYLFPTKHAEE